MNEIQLFSNPEFGSVRKVEIDGEPWLVGKDVAEALGYSNSRKALADHVDAKDKGVTKCDTLGGPQDLTIINRSGLNALVLSSKLPKAKKFKHWVTSEVLPSLQDNGMYLVGQEQMTDAEFMAHAVLRAQKMLESREQRIAELTQENQELLEDASYTRNILRNPGLVTITAIAKDYGMSGKTFNKLLHSLGIQYKQGDQWLLYSKYQDKGYTHSETFDFTHKDGTPDVNMVTMWTQRGREFLYNMLKAEGIVPQIENTDLFD